MRRRGNEMVLESPRAGALFKICDPKIAAAGDALDTATDQTAAAAGRFSRGRACSPCWWIAKSFSRSSAGDDGLRPAEGDDNLVLWDFHDLLFHARSTEGRHANPLGGVYPYAGLISPLPAVRPRWPGKKIDLRKFSAAPSEPISPVAKLLRERHSTRDFDDRRPITLAELSQFLDGAARVQSKLDKRRSISATAADAHLSVEAVSFGRRQLRA